MKIKKSELLQALKADLLESQRMQKDWLAKRTAWYNESMGMPYGNEEDGKSKIVSKDIKKVMEWMLPKLTDTFLNNANIIKCNPVTFEDAHSARQNELLLNTQFCRKFDRYNFIMKATKVLLAEGTVVVQTGWDYEDEEIVVPTEVVSVNENGDEYVEVKHMPTTRVIKNQPTATVCRNEDIFLDPTCMDDMDKCQFVIHRYQTSLSALKADGRYHNLDKVAATQPSLMTETQYYREDLTFFEFKDSARKKFIINEYWGYYDIDGDGEVEPIICAWVNDVIVRLETNPYPDKKPPFIVVPFTAIPFQMFGEAMAETIGDNQKVKTAITRGIIDNMARSNNGQVGIMRGTLDMANRKKFLQGKNFEYTGNPQSFWQGSFNEIPSSAFNMLGIMSNEIESQTGVKSFTGGINGNTLGATATSAKGALDATALRTLSLVRNMAENLFKPLMRKWMAYNGEFLQEEEIVRITNEQYVPIRRDDLDGRIDIDIEISTAEDNATKSQELSFLLQTVGPNEDPMIRKELMAQVCELMKMPDLAERLRAYQPQPDPMQQQIQQLQLQKLMLENEVLKATVADKNARAGENTVDMEVKKAKAAVESAKARKLHSDADMQDLDFLRKNDGIDQQEAMQKQDAETDRMAMQHGMNMQMAEHKRLSDLDKEAMKQYGAQKQMTSPNPTRG